jgi:drug/metabolite transporter (DMT)-like permease
MNGSIGFLTKVLLLEGLTTLWIAILKAFLGFLGAGVVIWFWKTKQTKPKSFQQIKKVVIAAFFGMFLLSFFETAAYRVGGAASVVVTLMATSCLTAMFGSWFFFKAQPQKYQWLGLALSVGGIFVMLGVDERVSLTSLVFASVAGFGYGCFTVLVKVFKLRGGVFLTRQLLGFGGIWLLIPLAYSGDGLAFQVFLQWQVWVCLFLLAIFPSIMGFYCTTRAINLLPPSTVQFLELCEPFFAAMFAFAFLGESLTTGVAMGGALTLIGVCLAIRSS